MRSPLRPLLLAGLTWAGAASAQPAAKLEVQPGAELVVEGTSTVRDFRCIAQDLSAHLEPASPQVVLTLEQLAQAVREVRLEVPTGALDCDNETMNEHMFKALGLEKHPTITLRVTRYEVGEPTKGAAAVRMFGELTLAGVTRPVTVKATAKPGPDGTLRLEGRHALRMTEWGVKPPSLMLGTMKVHEAVHIRFQLGLKQR